MAQSCAVVEKRDAKASSLRAPQTDGGIGTPELFVLLVTKEHTLSFLCKLHKYFSKKVFNSYSLLIVFCENLLYYMNVPKRYINFFHFPSF